jgi:hypothetical protein
VPGAGIARSSTCSISSSVSRRGVSIFVRVCKIIENEITWFNLKMALAMQQAVDFLPSQVYLLAQMAHQAWWRDGIEVVSKCYLGENTWEITVVYRGRGYIVVYDTLYDRCDYIEPVEGLFDDE